jgi:guanylate kinase
MGKIFCLMGKSASGKDTIYTRLLETYPHQLKRVVPYTTRPIRSGEVEGETYFFCTDEKAEALSAAGKIIELRAYQTVHGIWKYFTADDGQICLSQDNYLMIGTLEAYEKIRDYFGPEHVCPLYVWVDDGVRLERALARERSQKQPKYAEMCRRFLADEQDFSEENLKRVEITVRFENTDMETVLADLWHFMEQEMEG